MRNKGKQKTRSSTRRRSNRKKRLSITSNAVATKCMKPQHKGAPTDVQPKASQNGGVSIDVAGKASNGLPGTKPMRREQTTEKSFIQAESSFKKHWRQVRTRLITPVNMEELWHKACTHYDVPEDIAKSWYTRIRQRLSEAQPTRHYHNWNDMLQRKKELLQHCKPALVLAVFFQYYHFDGINSCAKENCAAFEEFCRDAQLEDDQSKCLILKLLGDKSIENELVTTYEEDANLLQDIDLAVLAATPEDYKRYTQLLRQEYNHMNDANYKMMRLKVLQTLLTIPNIFSTTEFQARYETTARTNITEEIISLKA